MNSPKPKYNNKTLGFLLITAGVLFGIIILPFALKIFPFIFEDFFSIIFFTVTLILLGLTSILPIYFGIVLINKPQQTPNYTNANVPIPQKSNSNIDFTVEQALLNTVKDNNIKEVFHILRNNHIDFNSSFFQYDHPLFIAIEREDIDMVKLLIENGADLNNSSLSYGTSPLNAFCFAVNYDCQEIVEYMLTKNPSEDLIFDALVIGANQSNQIYKMLLNLISDVNKKSRYCGMTLLMGALSWSQNFSESIEVSLERIKMLLDKGANPYIKDNNGKNAFNYTKDPDIINLMYKYDYNRNIRDNISQKSNIKNERNY